MTNALLEALALATIVEAAAIGLFVFAVCVVAALGAGA